ncbi:transposase, IS605 OrfB family [Halothece sp. PCC 7418]|uniref:RNA-guided endonuclease InsQ/TnpB family protein n=2 Tax=Halothece sp. (strain PCC 7418) TaxID=65093 RepID=UPI0002A07880|nr:RNA-guided endonuclease TnpB family protein [Halothece sp. PCC 7418]AFZ42898.1 transposase, IS605 OrfB family [Halothece sp. PCC 7418]
MLASYQFKLKPKLSQVAVMEQWINMLRAHYNFCLRDRIESYEQVRSPKLGNYSDLTTQGECCPLTCSVSKNSNLGYPYKANGKKRNAYEQQSSELSILKKARPWYAEIHSTILQQNLKRLEVAFKNFFEGRGYPKFKTKQKFKSFNYPPNQVQVKGNKIYLPKIGWMRFFQSRPFPEGFSLRSVTVRKKADGWYVSIGLENKDVPEGALSDAEPSSARVAPQSSPKTIDEINSVVGGDLGSNKLLALSNGEQIANPQFEKRLERTKTIRQRRASRKKRGSKNQKKAYQKLARLDQKIVNQRTDYQWKVAHQLVRLADVIVLEDLNIKGMIKRCQPKKDENGKYLKNGQSAKRALNRLIRDCAWGELKIKIQSVAEKFGCLVVEVNPKHTSQQCSACGKIDKQNRKGEKFACIECGHVQDADNQAAINIAKRGIKQLNLSLSKLLGVTQKVTANSEATGDTRNGGETSVSLETEPSNPKQLSLFEWIGDQVTGFPESPTKRVA